MADGEANNSPSPFDVRTVQYLVRLMGKYDLNEIDLREGELRIRLRRGGQLGKSEPMGVVQMPHATGQQIAMPQGGAPTLTLTPPPEPPSKPLIEIKSPTPGTFYTASKPDSEPFVRVGSRVQPDTVVCIIEAMKVFNEIPAECNGTIVAITVENQQPVEYGQVLFKVDPTG